MLEGLVKGQVDWLNAFPCKNGISIMLSPYYIVEGKGKPYMTRRKISFALYAMVYMETTNTTASRITLGIALRESNEHGGHFFMSLISGKRIHGYLRKELPIDVEVIDRVEELATKQKQSKLVNRSPLFEWSPGEIINDELVQEEEFLHEEIDEIEERDECKERENENHQIDDVVQVEEMIVTDDKSIEVEGDDNENGSISNDIVLTSVIEEEQESDESDDKDIEIIVTEENEETVEKQVDIDIDNFATSDIENAERPRRSNAGNGVERLPMAYGGKYYITSENKHFLLKLEAKERTEESKRLGNFMKRTVDVIFAQEQSNEQQYA